MASLPTLTSYESLPVKATEIRALHDNDLLDIEEAISHLSNRVRENSKLVDEYIELGRLFRKKGEYRKSFILLRNLLIRDDLRRGQTARVFGELGYNYLHSRTFDFGESYFLQSLKLNKDSIYVTEGLYQSHRQNGNLEKAMETLKVICRAYPERKKDLVVLLSEVALTKAKNQQMGIAKKMLDQAFDLKIESAFLYLAKAQIQTLEQKRKEAIETLEEFIQKWPGSTLFALKKIEGLYYEMNQYSRYPYTLAKCIQKNPQNFYAHHALGKYMNKIKKPEEALDHYRRALELCPFSIPTLKEIIKLYTQKQDTTEALGAIESFLSSLPNQRVFSCSRCQKDFQQVPHDCTTCGGWNSFDIKYVSPNI